MDLQAFVPAGGAPVAAAAPIRFLGTVEGASADVNSASINIAPAVAVALPVCAAAVASARSSKNSRRSRASAGRTHCSATAEKPFAAGLIGGESAFSSFEYNFDPLKLSERNPGYVGWFREAELKHGRIAMLAWVGLVVPEFVRIPGDHPCYSVATVVEAHNVCADSYGPLSQVLLWVALFELLTAMPKATFFEMTPENAGDYKLGLNFLPQDPEKAKEMKLKELKNGRLAMLAFGGAITQATLTGGGFPWLYATSDSAKAPGTSSSVSPATSSRSGSRLTMRAESTGYKMSKAVPFLPVSPALEGWVGEEEGFDPIGMSLAFDIRWLREAELKHGRVSMLATVGWITTDLGYRVPGEPFQISTIEAHDVMTEFGAMPQMLVWIFCAEIFGFLAITNMMEGTTDRKPGDFGIRLLYPEDAQGQYDMQLKELRNGRLAMLAYGGIATQAILTQSTWPFFAHGEDKKSSRGRSAFCGAPHQSGRFGGVAVKAKETSASLPFMPKPKNLKGFVGEEQEFDPIGFSDRIDIRWLREAELKHGRVCMLATVGFVAQQYITFPGVAPCPDSLQAVYQAPPGLMASLIFAAGYIESTSYGGKLTLLDMFEDSDRAPGDLNFGKRFLDGMSEKDAYQTKLKELQNGRLAMFALGGMVHHNLVVQGPLFPTFPEGWAGPQNTWKVVGALEQFLRGMGPS